LNSKKFWKEFSEKGVKLAEVIGFEVLEKDILFWISDYVVDGDFHSNRNFYFGKNNLESCKEVVFKDFCYGEHKI